MSTQEKKGATTAVTKKEFDITAYVMKKVDAFQKSGELKLPQNYSAENAIRGAQLILTDMKASGKPILEHCTKASIANALFKMVTLGLSVVKKQGSFIPYGDQLNFQEEYTGNIVLAKRYGGLAENPKARVIYQGDEFDFEIDPETGRQKIISHKPSLASLGNKSKILGAYCIYVTTDGKTDVEIMNMEQIQAAWEQGSMKGNSPAHKKFADQMSIKTVINRACKLLIRGSDDAALFSSEDDDGLDGAKRSVDKNIRENANGETIDIDAIEVEEEEVKQVEHHKEQPTKQPDPVKEEAKEESNGNPKKLF